jgi:UPF0755 protein
VKRLVLPVFSLFLVCLFGLGYLAGFVLTPYQGIAPVVEIEVRRGESLSSVAKKLRTQRVISGSELFRILARVQGVDKKVHAGLYRFDRPLSPLAVLDGMVLGRTVFHKVTIPEGFTARDIAELLADKGLVKRERFEREAENPETLARLGLTDKGIEGYLFPTTYYFRALSTEQEIIGTMLAQFEQMFTPEMMARAARMGFTTHEIVTLASIIEKESSHAAERPLVAAVFHNRLRIGMPLQSDPTVIYGLQDFNGNITRRDLRRPSPYNTYTIPALPPGPIANPGLESIQAALAPAAVPYLYFVSKNDGSHFFSKSLREHNRAVRKYQLSKRRSS